MTNHRQIAITTTKKGQTVAYRYCPYGRRWFRTSLADAELALATEQAIRVPFVSFADGKPSAMNQTAAYQPATDGA